MEIDKTKTKTKNNKTMETTKTKKSKAVSAYFTKFESGTNWCSGKIGKYNFNAKIFNEGSTFGIKDGRVSKLSIWDEEIWKKEDNFFKACIVNYDRGWDIKPKKEFKPYFNAVMELLENAPKRF